MGGVGISVTLLVLSCVFEPIGEVENEGRCVCETELSALDLSCSDQLKPLVSPGRAETG